MCRPGPGAIALTRTPLPLYSTAHARVIASSAAFVAPYAPPPTRPTAPAMLLRLTMLPRPLAAIPGASAAAPYDRPICFMKVTRS